MQPYPNHSGAAIILTSYHLLSAPRTTLDHHHAAYCRPYAVSEIVTSAEKESHESGREKEIQQETTRERKEKKKTSRAREGDGERGGHRNSASPVK